jgi:hypothetical protein
VKCQFHGDIFLHSSTLNVLGDTQNLKVAWGVLEKRFGAKQEGLQSALTAKLHLMPWNGTGSIYTHRDYMVDLRIQLADTGKTLSRRVCISLSPFLPLSIPSLPCMKTLCTTSTSYVTSSPSTKCGRIYVRRSPGRLKQPEESIALFG